jgi:hypothetical protein
VPSEHRLLLNLVGSLRPVREHRSLSERLFWKCTGTAYSLPHDTKFANRPKQWVERRNDEVMVRICPCSRSEFNVRDTWLNMVSFFRGTLPTSAFRHVELRDKMESRLTEVRKKPSFASLALECPWTEILCYSMYKVSMYRHPIYTATNCGAQTVALHRGLTVR